MIKRIIWLIIFAGLLIYTVPKILFQLSILVERFNSDTTIEEDTGVLFPPILDTLPEATNSSTLTVKGFSPNSEYVELYINDILKEKVTLATKDDSFTLVDVSLYEGNNAITAVAYGVLGEKSTHSDPMTVFLKKSKPKLIVESPDDGAEFVGSNKLEFRGITDPENVITVNGRWTRVLTDGTFKSTLELAVGENIIEVEAEDRAGNTFKVSRTVTYSE